VPTEVVATVPVTCIEEVRLPSSVSVAVAPGSAYIVLRASVEVASPFNIIIGGVFVAVAVREEVVAV
jgi:hypothetical protein